MRKIAIVLSSILFTLIIGCGDDAGPPESTDEATPADEVRVLDEAARQDLQAFEFDVDSNSGELRFDASSDFADSITEGRILASRPIDETAPSGLLQRVESVRTEGDEIVATTRQATLAETFERADFEQTTNIEPSNVETNQELRPGVTFHALERESRQGLGSPFELDFDEVLLDTDGDRSTTNDQLLLNGQISFSASFDAALQVRQFKLRRFLFAVDLQESVDIEMIGNFDDAQIDESKQLTRINLDTIVFQVGPVPVVIRIDLVVSIGVDGTITARVQASASQSTAVRLGAEYTDGDGWNGINQTDSNFEVPPPEFEFTSTDARGYVRPQVEIKLYGIAGPFIFAEPYVRFAAELYTTPFWQLYGGLSLGAGFVVTVPVLGEVASWEASFEAFEETIEESSNRPPTLEIVSPGDGSSVTAGSDLSLVVTAQDREDASVPITVTGPGVSESSGSSEEGGETTITVNDLCEGVQELTVTATDSDGASDAQTISIVVENATPTVEIDTSTLTGTSAPPIFPGGYVTATADVSDPRCSSADPVAIDLVEWYVDGAQVSRSTELVTRLPSAEYGVGDDVTIEARFDDGQAVGTSNSIAVTLESEPAGDLPAEVVISSCSVCDGAVIVGGDSYIPEEATLTGVAFDPKEGELTGSQLNWTVENEDGSPIDLGTGNSITFRIDDVFLSPATADGTNTVTLSVDDGGQTVTDTVDFFVSVGG